MRLTIERMLGACFGVLAAAMLFITWASFQAAASRDRMEGRVRHTRAVLAQVERIGVALAFLGARRLSRRRRRSEARLLEMVDNLPGGAVFVSGERLRMNRAVERITGYGRDELPTLDAWFAALYGERAAEVRAFYEDLRRDGFPEAATVPVTRKDGVERQVHFAAWRDDGGEVWLLHDRTDEITANERFRVLFEHSSDAHLLFDESGIIDCNRAAVEMLRCRDKAEVLSLHPAVLSPEFQPDGRRSLEKCVEMDATARERGHHRFEWMHRKSDGEVFPVEVSLTPVTLAGKAALLVVWHDLTERKRAEDEVIEARRFAESVADASTSIIYVLDVATGAPVYANRDATAFLGCTPEQIAAGGDDFLHGLVHPDDRAFSRAHFAHFRSLADGEVIEFEQRMRHAGGGYRWLWVRERVFRRGPDGTPAQVMGTAQDVTGAREAVEAARRSEARLAEAQRVARIGSWEFDIASGEITWSGEMYRLLGFDPSAGPPSYEELLACYHPDDAPMHRAVVAKAVEDGQPYAFDIRRVGADGETRWFHAIGQSVRGADGRTARLYGTLADVTEARRAEDALREQQRFIESVAASSPNILYVFDFLERRSIYANREVGAVLGFSPEEIREMGTDLFPNLMHPDDVPTVQAHFDRLTGAGDGEVLEVEYRMRHAEGDWRWIRSRDTVFARGEDGAATQTLGTAQDITEARRYEQRLQAANEWLEDANGQLSQMNEELERRIALVNEQAAELEAQKAALEKVSRELAEANARLHAQATTDGLTGLHNRRAFDERLNEAFARASRSGEPLALALLDVDRFKEFNDTYGHPAGDGVLRRVALVLRNAVRSADVAARYGGAEFAVVLHGTGLEGALDAAERIREAVAAQPWELRGVTVSVGVAVLTPATATPGELLARADTALYAAKAGGRNRVSSQQKPALKG